MKKTSLLGKLLLLLISGLLSSGLAQDLPADAAPDAEQVLRVPCDNTRNETTFDFAVSVYQRYCVADLFQDTLVDLDKDFNVMPASAESWSVSDDGLTWTSFAQKPHSAQ